MAAAASLLVSATLAAALALTCSAAASAWESTLMEAVHDWAEQMGKEMNAAGQAMRHRKVQESFRGANIVHINGSTLLRERANLIWKLLQRRADAVTKIREKAESVSSVRPPPAMEFPAPYDAVKSLPVNESDGVVWDAIPASYEAALVPSPRFPTPVNTSVSAVHFPSDVYDGRERLTGAVEEQAQPETLDALQHTKRRLRAIQHGVWWSKELDQAFRDNFKRDPQISWQFFAHTRGFMRLFPATRWEMDEDDVFDARFRPWFAPAATSTKDVVILVDNSGSMKFNNKLARQIVHSILDTLSPDDYVNILLFARNETNSSIPCLKDTLVPATLRNVIQLKQSLDDFEPKCFSNLEIGIISSLKILDQAKSTSKGAQCNQAIMLITDGPYIDTSMFQRYNMPFGSANKPVRIFTYHIGKELTEAPGLKWIACQNQGWYLNVTRVAAVRDRVATYIPVMARPLIMQNEHPVHWSHLYADVTDPSLTFEKWMDYEKKIQKRRILTFCKEQRKTNVVLEDKVPFMCTKSQMYILGQILGEDEKAPEPTETMIITVSTPIYNTTQNMSVYGELIGVAGVDIPLDQIQELLPSHKIGVNAYYFMVNNNGHVIFHPDHRPMFMGILKPSYNGVDMSDLELDLLSEGVGSKSEVEGLRRRVVNQATGSIVLTVDQTFDRMTRLERTKRRYFFTGLENTTFSLVLAVHDDYGLKEITFPTDTAHGERLSEHFKGQWSTHPSWRYCRDPTSNVWLQSGDLLRYLISLDPTFRKDNTQCDKELIQSLIGDASATAWFPHLENQRATSASRRPFSDFGGPDEVWYRRAALHADVMVVSSGPVSATTPSDATIEEEWPAIDKDDMVVTVSKAVVVSRNVDRSVAAVVGMQFSQSQLQAAFDKITAASWCKGGPCVPPCGSPAVECFLLDADSIVVASSVAGAIGAPFGAARPALMQLLVQDDIFRLVRIIDSQSVCIRPMKSSGLALLGTEAWMSATLLLATVASLSLQIQLHLASTAVVSLVAALASATKTNFTKEFYERSGSVMRLLHTRPESCQQRIDTLRLRSPQELSHSASLRRLASCPERPFAAAVVPGTNMLLVSILASCLGGVQSPNETDSSDVRFDLRRVEVNRKSCLIAATPKHRLRPRSCLTHHDNEEMVATKCGLDHMVSIEEVPPEPPMFRYDFTPECRPKQ